VVRPVNPGPHHRVVDYWEQLDETVVTEDTRTCWPPDIDEDALEGVLEDEVPDVDVPEVPEELVPDDESRLDSVPVISTFSPTCLLSSLSWPSRT
jgi:hypothetical protein